VISVEDIEGPYATTEDVKDPKTGQMRTRKIMELDKVIKRIVLTMTTREREGKEYGVIVIAEGLAELLPDNALVVEEAPSHRGILHDHLPITATDTGFLTMASGTLGYGVPGVVGAALARPDRKVVGVIGDGSSMYGIQALWTAAREELPVTFVILDNSEYAAVRILGDAIGGAKLPGTELGGIGFAALAESMGCHGVTITEPSELVPGLTSALADPRPTLVHVRVAASSKSLY